MLKKCIKNFFSCVKYVFTPLGTMFLGIMLGVSIFIPNVIAAANQLVEGITELSQNVNLDFAVLWNDLWESIRSLNWNDPIAAIETLLHPQWLNEVLTQILAHVLGTDFDSFKEQSVTIVSVFGDAVAANVVVFFVCWILGFIAGMALTRLFIRRNIAKRSVWKFLLAYFLNTLVSAMFAVATLIVYSLWAYSIIFAVILALLFSGIIALIQAYLLYAHKKLPFKQIVNLKNAGLNILASLIIFLISVGFTLIAVAINSLMGLFVGLSLFVVALTVINLNAESFVLELVANLVETSVSDDSKANDVAPTEKTLADENKSNDDIANNTPADKAAAQESIDAAVAVDEILSGGNCGESK